MPFRQWEDPESRLRLRTRPFEKAQMHFCSDAQMPRLVKTAIAVLTDRVRELFGIISAKEVKTYE